MRHVSVISGHPISISFHGLMGCQRDPRDRGVINTGCVLSLDSAVCSLYITVSFHLSSLRRELKLPTVRY